MAFGGEFPFYNREIFFTPKKQFKPGKKPQTHKFFRGGIFFILFIFLGGGLIIFFFLPFALYIEREECGQKKFNFGEKQKLAIFFFFLIIFLGGPVFVFGRNFVRGLF